MKYTAVIFDMDGTIIDSEHVWGRATRELIESRGIHMTNELATYFNQRLHGTDLRSSCSMIKDYLALPDHLDALIQEKQKRANALYAQEVRFIEGFIPFHTELLQLDCITGLATNATISTVQVADARL